MNNNTRKTLFLLTDIQIYQILFENIFDHFSYIFPPCFSPICPVVLQKKIYLQVLLIVYIRQHRNTKMCFMASYTKFAC